MSSENSNDPKATDRAASSWTSPQPQKHFRPSIEEEAIPWAEIIFEEEPAVMESHPVAMSAGKGFVSRVLSTQAETFLDEQVVGPPLAVLAIVLLVFLLLAVK
jgi:hypothetical protein